MRAAATVDALVSSIDIAPTILQLGNANIGGQIQGISFLPLMTGGSAGAARRPYVLMENYSDDRPLPWVLDADYRAIRTNRHKLIHWVQHPEFDELYDLTEDPHEERNVIKEQANRRTVEGLHADLGKLVQQSISL